MKLSVASSAFAVLCITATASAQTPPPVLSSCGGQTVAFNEVRLPRPVLANGKALAADTYQVRITTERPTPAAGQSANAECWVEFVKAGAVAGRELASVVPPTDIATVAKEPAPKTGAFRVDLLKEGEYLRVWMNSGGTHYIVNMPVAR